MFSAAFFAHPGQALEATVDDGLLQLGHVRDSELLPGAHYGLGAEPGDVHEIEYAVILDDIVGNSFEYIDIGTKKVKELFYYYILQEILQYKKQGLQIIIVNSCKLQNNFRYVDNGYNYTYSE